MNTAAYNSYLTARHTAATALNLADLVQVIKAVECNAMICLKSESWVLVGTEVSQTGDSDGSQLGLRNSEH